ncbi:MAG: acetate--CoA ligase [Candidatus Methanomethylicus sp.]|nr:acetate--CoA ligase [Candidatus Methanomethylicus sp.]
MDKLFQVLPTSKTMHPDVNVLRELRNQSLKDPEMFWEEVAEDLFWYEKSTPIYQEMDEPPYAKWFPNRKTNISYNALDRHISGWRRNKVAYYWEGENGERQVLTYNDLSKEVNKLASVLKRLGVKKGDRIAIHLPMIPELPISMLAALRLGAIHNVIFSGFGYQAIADMINDSKCKLIITADGGYRRGKIIEYKSVVDEAIERTMAVEKVLVVKRAGNKINFIEDRDEWYHELMESAESKVEPERLEGTAPSFIIYTSGTTGTPKGVTHSTAGYMVWAYFSQKVVFDTNDNDIYWCTADIGWITGHSYLVYGPLLCGATSVLYEGAPDYPKPDRWWEIVEKYGVTVFYTSPTSIRMHMKNGEIWAGKHNLSTLRILGTVGEAINPEAWDWYYRFIGQEKTPIVDTWFQTETGGIMISPQPGLAPLPLKKGSATFPLPGVDAVVLNEEGKQAEANEKGYLAIRKPWPGEFMTLWNDKSGFKTTYFTRFPGYYYAGDFAMQDEEGYFWILGRADEVLKVAGHRIGTIEVEDALLGHPMVAEAAVIGKADPIKMQVPVAFVVLKDAEAASAQLRMDLITHIKQTIGSIAAPASIYFVEMLPKTKNGKIMRRVVKAVVEEKSISDVTTIDDEASVEEASKAYESFKQELNLKKADIFQHYKE